MERFNIFLILGIMLCAADSYAMGSKVDIQPMKPSQIILTDGEFLKYGNYVNDEYSEGFNVVSKINKADKTVKMYYHKVGIKDKNNIPSNYSNFNSFITVSLETGSLVEDYCDQTEYSKKNNIKGVIGYDLKVDLDDELVSYNQKIWDGYELKQTSSKIKVNRTYPVYNTMAFMWVGMRFLDIKSGGLLLLVEPMGVKDPIPCYVHTIGKEILSTPAGKFSTIKIGFVIADPFLGKLLDSFQKEGVIWVEDSPRALLIKAHNPMMTLVLENISNI